MPGYALETLRVEFAYRIRAHGDDVSPLIESSTNPAVVSKASEWSPVYQPTEVVSDCRKFRPRWTPRSPARSSAFRCWPAWITPSGNEPRWDSPRTGLVSGN